MEKKHGIIRLGRSKSPKWKKVQTVSSSASCWNPGLTSSMKGREVLGETSILNRTAEFIGREDMTNKYEYGLMSESFSGGFPPSPRAVQQRVLIKQNIGLANNLIRVRQSPPHRIVVLDGNPRIGTETAATISQKQGQFQRKIKMLETRIQQLHQENQECVMRAHEENRKMQVNYSVLERRFVQMENSKNREIDMLRQQLSQRKCDIPSVVSQHNQRYGSHQMNNIAHQVIQFQAQSPKQLKNSASVVKHQNSTSINKNEDSREATPIKLVSIEMKASSSEVKVSQNEHIQRIVILENENQSLKSQLHEMKNTIISISTIIEQNNKKIIESYEQKLASLSGELFSCREQLEEASHLKKQLKDNVQQSEEYAAQLLSKCKEVEMREEECRGLRKSLEGSKKEMDECITRLLAMSQELTIVGDHSSPINIPNVETDSRPLSQKISELEHQLKLRVTTSMSLGQQKSSQESCAKCKQLIKTLVLLKRKPE